MKLSSAELPLGTLEEMDYIRKVPKHGYAVNIGTRVRDKRFSTLRGAKAWRDRYFAKMTRKERARFPAVGAADRLAVGEAIDRGEIRAEDTL